MGGRSSNCQRRRIQRQFGSEGGEEEERRWKAGSGPTSSIRHRAREEEEGMKMRDRKEGLMRGDTGEEGAMEAKLDDWNR